MTSNTIIYIFNRILRVSILLFILYLIFTNFGTFLMILGIIFALIAFFIYNLKKKIKTNGFEFRFDKTSFENAQGFNYEDFRNYTNAPKFGEVQKAKEFFGFTGSPSKEDIKKRYKELAKKYHPDINGGDDTKMKELNHYRDILIKTVE